MSNLDNTNTANDENYAAGLDEKGDKAPNEDYVYAGYVYY